MMFVDRSGGRRRRCVFAAVVLQVAALAYAPMAHAYDSWCDLFETHGARIALVSEQLRVSTDRQAVDRLNDFYGKVIPQLNTIASATFWFPNVWGSPDIRTDTRALMSAMRDLQEAANGQLPAASEVQAVDDALGVLHGECVGKRGLASRDVH